MSKTAQDRIAHEQEAAEIASAKSDPAAFEVLFNRYHGPIFNYLLRRTSDAVLADDLASATFLKALTNLSSFRYQGVSFSAWLFRIATNEVNLHHRQHRRFTALSDDAAARLQADAAPDASLLQAEARLQQNKKFQRMHSAIQTLDRKYQDVLTLRYFENKSLLEIAAILDLPENTVKTHLRRGLLKLREIL